MPGDLGPDPVKVVEHRLGELGLQFLLASLAVTPLRRFGLNLVKFRRALGLVAFGYVALHLTAWVWLDMGLRWSEVTADLWKRPYIILGMAGFVALLPLAATSSNAAIRWMGPAAWRRLRIVVAAARARVASVAAEGSGTEARAPAVAGVVHLLLLVKVWTLSELTYVALTSMLLGLRLMPAARSSGRAAA